MSLRLKRRRARGRTAAGNWLWGSVIAAIVTLVVVTLIFMKTRLETGGVDEWLCPDNSGPTAGLAVLLDLTESLNSVQHERLRGVLEDRIANAQQGTLIAVGAVREKDDDRGTEFARCKPMEGQQANDVYQNPRIIEERYNENFLEPFQAILTDMLDRPEENASPIMESLQSLLVSIPTFVDAEYPRRVIIVSDLLQHSEAFSLYRGDTWRRFIQSVNAPRVAGRLMDVTVEICRIPRPNAAVDDSQADNFWINYFDRAGVQRIVTSSCDLGDL